uniref:hypothetical protein n=1 Tax=Prevotella aurantiaca TaxID=596085 RepID=UPI001F19A927|nr:hypothetical protein [Prevotella aurantiaca]
MKKRIYALLIGGSLAVTMLPQTSSAKLLLQPLRTLLQKRILTKRIGAVSEQYSTKKCGL